MRFWLKHSSHENIPVYELISMKLLFSELKYTHFLLKIPSDRQKMIRIYDQTQSYISPLKNQFRTISYTTAEFFHLARLIAQTLPWLISITQNDAKRPHIRKRQQKLDINFWSWKMITFFRRESLLSKRYHM